MKVITIIMITKTTIMNIITTKSVVAKAMIIQIMNTTITTMIHAVVTIIKNTSITTTMNTLVTSIITVINMTIRRRSVTAKHVRTVERRRLKGVRKAPFGIR